MKIKLIAVGKTTSDYLKTGIAEYEKRLRHYYPFELKIIPDIKNSKKYRAEQIKVLEGESILSQFATGDEVYLFDEVGKEYNSVQFAKFIEKKAIAGVRQVVFVIGGAYGFSPAVYQRANGKVALSQMTFSHQMVRLFAVEQVYRAMTIIKGEPYHHQ